MISMSDEHKEKPIGQCTLWLLIPKTLIKYKYTKRSNTWNQCNTVCQKNLSKKFNKMVNFIYVGVNLI